MVALPPAFVITRIKRGPNFDMKSSHVHPTYEIYYLLSGARKMFFDDSIHVLGRGDLVFIPSNTIHRTLHQNDKAHERFAVTFGDEMIPDLRETASGISFRQVFLKDPVTHFTGANREYVEGLLERMLSEYEQPDAFSPVNIQCCLQELMVFLIRCKHYRREEHVQDIDITDRVMQKAARYIKNNYMNDISLESVAEFVNLSPCYFSKKFKTSTGFGYREYLVIVRIQEACSMLLETNKSITEIALECGFSDSNYFGDVFKREKGVSPLKYRKNSRYIRGTAEEGARSREG